MEQEKKRGRKRGSAYTEEQKIERVKESKRKYARKRYANDPEYRNQMVNNISTYRTKVSNELKELKEIKARHPELFV